MASCPVSPSPAGKSGILVPKRFSVARRSLALDSNRTELVAEVAEKSGKSQATVNAVLDAVFQVFESSVSKGEKITIPGWMAIERTDRAARTGRNPQTGETIQIPAGHGVKLTAGSKLKAAVAKKK